MFYPTGFYQIVFLTHLSASDVPQLLKRVFLEEAEGMRENLNRGKRFSVRRFQSGFFVQILGKGNGKNVSDISLFASNRVILGHIKSYQAF